MNASQEDCLVTYLHMYDDGVCVYVYIYIYLMCVCLCMHDVEILSLYL